jgi:hypothetical protein
MFHLGKCIWGEPLSREKGKEQPMKGSSNSECSIPWEKSAQFLKGHRRGAALLQLKSLPYQGKPLGFFKNNFI